MSRNEGVIVCMQETLETNKLPACHPSYKCKAWVLVLPCIRRCCCVWQVKENICKEGFVVDKDDNSLTRSNAYMLELFQKAGMSVQ